MHRHFECVTPNRDTDGHMVIWLVLVCAYSTWYLRELHLASWRQQLAAGHDQLSSDQYSDFTCAGAFRGAPTSQLCFKFKLR